MSDTLSGTLADRKYWEALGSRFGLELVGWTYRNRATFLIRRTCKYLHLDAGDLEAMIEAVDSESDGG